MTRIRLPALPRVDVYHGSDGCPVVDIDTSDSGPGAHDARTVPFVRVAVNDDYVHDHGPAQPLSGSREALGIDDPSGPHDEQHSPRSGASTTRRTTTT